MYIRKTTTKKAADGTYYTTFRIVASERVQGKVKQRTLLNIGSGFDLHESRWPQLCKRIDDILGGTLALLTPEQKIEDYAQSFAARIISERSVFVPEKEEDGSYDEVDVTSLELTQPRSVGVENVALHAAKLLDLPEILQEAGLTQTQISMSLAGIIGRMANPGSEMVTWNWLTGQSALGELMAVDFSRRSAMGLYRASDALLQHKEKIEELLFGRICSLFSLRTTVTLYDLTNTYFEGQMQHNSKAARGFSKEKRSDCPLLTLGLVLDGSGFVKKSEVFEGNISEPATIQSMLKKLDAPSDALVVMDRGIATKATLEWLVAANYRYVVVSRERTRTFDLSKAQSIRTAQAQELQIYRELNEEGTEARLYCYSAQRAAKEQGITARFAGKLELGLRNLAESLTKSRTDKRKDKIIQRIGRLIEKNRGMGQHYSITVMDNAAVKAPNEPLLATGIVFEKKPIDGSRVTDPGVYCIRTNALWLEAEELWRTYITLTDLEAVFRSLKSELGLRPVYHQTAKRSEGHLFITVLAYQCVQAIRSRLRLHGITDSWQSLRSTLRTQHRVSVTFRQRNGSTLHIRKSTMPEAGQQRIYAALGLDERPGGVKRHSVPVPNTNV
jgi:transposase